MQEIDCPFRLNVRDEGQVATCAYLQQVTGVADETVCEVHRSACEACCSAFPSMTAQLNPVLPSLLYNVCSQSTMTDRIGRVQEWCDRVLLSNSAGYRRSVVHGCDAVFYAEALKEDGHRSIESLLEQKHIQLTLHLVDGSDGDLFCQYRENPRVRIHRDTQRRGLFANLHDLLPVLDSQYVALASAKSTSRSFRLANGTMQLDQDGAEFLFAAAETTEGIIDSVVDDSKVQFHVDSLVMRRSSLIDMGGIAEHSTDFAGELLARALDQQRKIICDSTPTITLQSPTRLTEKCPPGRPRGYSVPNGECDVVIPFRGQLDFVTAAIESVLDQIESRCVIHIVDDATPEDTTEFMNRWKAHNNVRLYRNQENIGQFASFNNVSRFCETGFVAVQDGDDISYPDRICESIRHLELSNCDLFAARTRLFGKPDIVEKLAHESLDADTHIRKSEYPIGKRPRYYLENPTVVWRLDSFRRMGGFADYGSGRHNRTGVDTEMMNRAYLAGAAIGVSQKILLDFRCHGTSATQTPENQTIRKESESESARRVRLMMVGPFDPRHFGSLSRYEGTTVRL